jgi:hypothetical protein
LRIAILSCLWKRPEVTELFAQGLNRLLKYNVYPLVVGSEGAETQKIAKDYGLMYLERPNFPLGAKFNAGMQALKRMSMDYVMVLGSDDFISDATFEYMAEWCHKGSDLIGFSDIWFYDVKTKTLRYWKGYDVPHRMGESQGAGRMLSRNILSKLKWSPWQSNANKGLDWTMTQRIKRIPHSRRVFSLKEKGLFAVDVKTDVNICHADLYKTEDENLLYLDQIPEKILKL